MHGISSAKSAAPRAASFSATRSRSKGMYLAGRRRGGKHWDLRGEAEAEAEVGLVRWPRRCRHAGAPRSLRRTPPAPSQRRGRRRAAATAARPATRGGASSAASLSSRPRACRRHRRRLHPPPRPSAARSPCGPLRAAAPRQPNRRSARIQAAVDGAQSGRSRPRPAAGTRARACAPAQSPRAAEAVAPRAAAPSARAGSCGAPKCQACGRRVAQRWRCRHRPLPPLPVPTPLLSRD